MATTRKSKLVDQAKEFLDRNASPNVTAELDKSLARKRVHQYNMSNKAKLPYLDSGDDPQLAIAQTAAQLYATRRKPIVELNWNFQSKSTDAASTTTNVHNGSKFLDLASGDGNDSTTENAITESNSETVADREQGLQLRQTGSNRSEDSSDMLFVSDLQKLVSFVMDYDPPRMRNAETQALYSAALASGGLRDMVTRPPSVARIRNPANLNAVIVIVLRAVSAYEADRFASCFAVFRERGYAQCDFASPFVVQNRCFDSAFLYYEPTACQPDAEAGVGVARAADVSSQSVTPQKSAADKRKDAAGSTEYEQEVQRRFESHRARCKNVYDVGFVYHNLSNRLRSEFTHLDRVRRTSLLCSMDDMREDGYPLPFDGRFRAFRYSLQPEEGGDACGSNSANDKWYAVPDDASPIFAVDCEMCATRNDEWALVRVSVVDEALQCVYDTLVRPDEPVTDYRTAYSGVSADMLENVAVRLHDVRRDLASLLPPNAILCGHSLNFDLHSMRIFHPFVIDTSRLFSRSATFYYGATNGVWNETSSAVSHSKPSLRSLAARFLNETIQADSRGHSSVEDARATMRLVQLRLRGESGDFGVFQPKTGVNVSPASVNSGESTSNSTSESDAMVMDTQASPEDGTQYSDNDSYCCADCLDMQNATHRPKKFALQNDFYEKLRSATQRRGAKHSGALSMHAVPLFYRPIRAVSACLIDEPGCSLDAFEARCMHIGMFDPAFRERTASWVVPDDASASLWAVERLKQLGEYHRWLESNNYDASAREGDKEPIADRSNLLYVHLHAFDSALRVGMNDQQLQQERLSELIYTHLLPVLNAAQQHQRNSLVLVALPGRPVCEADVRAGIADQVARGRCFVSVS